MNQGAPIVRTLLLLNIGLFVGGWLIEANFSQTLGLRHLQSPFFEPYQLLTHMFIHGGFWHLFGNMLALFIFGSVLENYMGSQRLLLFYMICGLGAAALYSGINYYEMWVMEQALREFMASPSPEALHQYIINYTGGYRMMNPAVYEFVQTHYADQPDSTALTAQARELATALYEKELNIPMVGASGAVFGILLAFGMLFPDVRLMLLFPPIPVKAKYLVGFYALYELYSIYQNAPGDNVAHFAHVGGMIFAFILLKVWGYRRADYY